MVGSGLAQLGFAGTQGTVFLGGASPILPWVTKLHLSRVTRITRICRAGIARVRGTRVTGITCTWVARVCSTRITRITGARVARICRAGIAGITRIVPPGTR